MAKTKNDAVMTKDNAALTTPEKNITDNILNRVKALQADGGISFPANYSYQNALKSAWLVLQEVQDKDKRPALTVCSKESIANSLLDMVIQGLSPAKKQCYFVVFGSKLQLMRSYMGTVAVTKRLSGIKDVFANVIYDADDFEYKINLQTGLKEIIKHDQDFENIDPSKIKGAYAVIHRENLPPYVEVMNFEQIKKAWMQGAAKGNSPAHQNFTDEMAKKTVINRACKLFFNTSDDSDLLIEAINRTGDAEQLKEVDYEEENIQEEIKENANKKELDIPAQENATGSDKKEEQEEPELSGPGF